MNGAGDCTMSDEEVTWFDSSDGRPWYRILLVFMRPAHSLAHLGKQFKLPFIPLVS